MSQCVRAELERKDEELLKAMQAIAPHAAATPEMQPRIKLLLGED